MQKQPSIFSISKNLFLGSFLLVIFALSGCTGVYSNFEPYSPQVYPSKTDAYDIPLSAGVPVAVRYEKIGVVWAVWYNYPGAEQQAKKLAKEAGADAIISVQYQKEAGNPRIMGMAIRFLDKIDTAVKFTNPNIVEH